MLKSQAPEATKSDPPASLRQAAYDRIEDLLNAGVLKPGHVVSQRELVERTGMTLGAVREAIPRLEAEGLLQTLPKRGLMVPSLEVGFVRDAYQLRMIIELGAVPQASKFLPEGQIDEWIAFHEEAAAELRRGPGLDAANRVQRLDWIMHGAIVAATGNKLMDNIHRITAIKIRMAVQSRIRVTPDNATRVIAEHLVFLRALRDRDLETAKAALSRHIDNSMTIALGGSV
ncbi:MAG TPA: GntR family transcriptional regulator [Ensifer sp.]|nr:GntR family transcriptional regulator [Ensifer sp.]